MSTTTWSGDAARASSRSMILEAFNSALAMWSRRKTAMLVADLDDHVLRDIGIEPGDVRRPRAQINDWVVDARSGPARLVFIGR